MMQYQLHLQFVLIWKEKKYVPGKTVTRVLLRVFSVVLFFKNQNYLLVNWKLNQ